MRFLVLSPVIPYPPNSGFAIRVHQMATLLARRHEVTLLAFADGDTSGPQAALAAAGVAVHTVPRPAIARAKRSGQLMTLLSPMSYIRLSHSSPALQRLIDAQAATAPFDAVFVESSNMGGYRFPSATTVLLT